VQQIQYRHWHGPYRHHHWHRHGSGNGAAVLGGLAAGAIVGSAIANSQARANAESYCAQRYRSYVPTTWVPELTSDTMVSVIRAGDASS
jgi:hypothetical protein